MTAENFPQLNKDIKPRIQEAQNILSGINIKKFTVSHVTVKQRKAQDKKIEKRVGNVFKRHKTVNAIKKT